jgi:hypothetical protein
MGELSVYCGCNNKGEPFVQILNNKKAIVQLNPRQATEFGLALISSGAEALLDATAFHMVTSQGRSAADGTALIAALRNQRAKMLADGDPVMAMPASHAPTDSEDVPENMREQLAVERAKLDPANLKLLLRDRLLEDTDEKNLRIRVSSYAAIKGDVISIGSEYMIVDEKKSHVQDGRYYCVVTERGSYNTTPAKYSRGAEITVYKLPEA